MNINLFVFIVTYSQMGKWICKVINTILIIAIEATKATQLDISYY